GVVDVVGFVFGPVGFCTAHTVLVGGVEVAQECFLGPLVGGDVVDDQQQDVFLCTESKKGGAQGNVTGDVEGPVQPLLHGRVQVRLVHVGRFQQFGQFIDGEDVLEGFVPVVDVDGAQRLVSGHGVTQRLGKGLGVECAVQP